MSQAEQEQERRAAAEREQARVDAAREAATLAERERQRGR